MQRGGKMLAMTEEASEAMPTQEDESTESIVRFAVAFAASLNPSDFMKIDIGPLGTRWRFQADGSARPVQELMNAISRPFESALSPVTYSDVVEAIRADPQFGPLMDGLVGDQSSQTIFNADTVLSRATEGLADRHQISEGDIRANVERLRDELRSPFRTATLLIPTPGLRSDLFPIALEPGLELDRLTEDEVTVCARAGVLKSPFPGFSTELLRPEDCVGVRISIRNPSLVTPQGTDPAERLRRFQEQTSKPHRFGERSPYRAEEAAEDVLSILRIALEGRVRTDGVVVYRPPGGMSWWSRPSRPFGVSDALVDEAGRATILSLWSEATSPRGRRLPAICLRRFNAAVDRFVPADAVIDHLIAAEALLLRDTGSASERGELKFRLALRGSTVLRELRDPLPTFRFLKASYDLRSTVAHGGSLAEKVHVAGRGDIPTPEFLTELEGLMRDLLRTAVEKFATTAGFATSEYWERLLFDGGTAPGP